MDGLLWLCDLRRFLFGALGLSPFHGPIVRMRFLVILAAGTAEKEQDFLSIARAHICSLWHLSVAVKRHPRIDRRSFSPLRPPRWINRAGSALVDEDG
jgi:hypothetical protein